MQQFLSSPLHRRRFTSFCYGCCIGDDSPGFVILCVSAMTHRFCHLIRIGDDSPILSSALYRQRFTGFCHLLCIGDDSPGFLVLCVSATIHRVFSSCVYRRRFTRFMAVPAIHPDQQTDVRMILRRNPANNISSFVQYFCD
jgi:hypothetical protein